MKFKLIEVAIAGLLVLATSHASAQISAPASILQSGMNNASYIQVVSGSVEVTTITGETIVVSAGQTIVVSSTGAVVATGPAASSMAAQTGAFNNVNVSLVSATGSAATATSAAVGSIAATGLSVALSLSEWQW